MTVDVENIVREVLARLNHSPAAAPADELVAGELSIEGKIVAIEQLQGKLAGIRQVSVPRGAIVTPAARDLLKEKNVQLAWRVAGEKASGGSSGSAVSLVLGVADTIYEPAKLVQALVKSGTAVSRLAQTGLAIVVSELTDAVAKSGQTGLLLTSQTATAVCLANRNRGVRAVTGENRNAIAAAVQAVGANVLVFDPARRGEWELKQIVGDFVRGAPRRCPENLKSLLG